MKIKKTNFANSWYPGSADECESAIKGFLTQSTPERVPEKAFFCGIVPHAGWYFSGGIACRVIQKLATDEPITIFLFGKHMRPHDALTVVNDGCFETPFGELEVDAEIAALFGKKVSARTISAEKTDPDNTIELQLPFIKYFFKNARVVPVHVPPSPVAVDAGLSCVDVCESNSRPVRIIGSTDLTHYGPNYGLLNAGHGMESVRWARDINDKKMIDAALAMEVNTVLKESRENCNACCGGAVAAVASAARKKGINKGVLTEYASSYDKNPSDSFVGYAGILY